MVSIILFISGFGLQSYQVQDLQIQNWTEQRNGQNVELAKVVQGKTEQIYIVRPITKLRMGNFRAEQFPPRMQIGRSNKSINLYLLQLKTPIFEAYLKDLYQIGVTVLQYLPDQTLLIRIPEGANEELSNRPYAHYLQAFAPEYRMSLDLLNDFVSGEEKPTAKYFVNTFEPKGKARVVAEANQLGAEVINPDFSKNLVILRLNMDQLWQLAQSDDVHFVDSWSEMEPDMDIVREISGANFIETAGNYRGQGVRGEIYDLGFNRTHVDFQSRPLINHDSSNNNSHGAACSGIVFGDGSGDIQATGLMPEGQGIVADSGASNRYDHTEELLDAPYLAVFQTSSVGNNRTLNYTNLSADMDEMLFDLGVLHCQSQSNARNRFSRPQAWAKNNISGGAFRHFNTLDKGDDCWDCVGNRTGSSGPAPDGRIKPDLSFFYDLTFTVTWPGNNAYAQFGGTSGATPSICGYTGLFFQMWSDGIFGNPTPGSTVFENRPKMSTAKAMMINTANPFPFNGAEDDFARVHQGWGMPDLQNMYELRDRFLIVDEAVILENQDVQAYCVQVDGDKPFRVTLAYTDPAGSPAAAEHLVNNLNLRVTSPSGDVFWGNVGLRVGNESISGGAPSDVDNVENVWIGVPEAGNWVIEVIAARINQDGHIETPELDADFSLVASGITQSTPDPKLVIIPENGFEFAPEIDVPVSAKVHAFGGLSIDQVFVEYRFSNFGVPLKIELSTLSDSYQGLLPGFFCEESIQIRYRARSGSSYFTYPESGWLSLTISDPQTVFEDDFETDQGWQVGHADDTATAGVWERVIPAGIKTQPVVDASANGRFAFVTEAELWLGPTDDYEENDVDNGGTSLISPVMDLSATPEARVRYQRWYSNGTRLYLSGYQQDDTFQVFISNDSGSNWVQVESVGPTSGDVRGGWISHEFRVADFVTPNAQIQLRFLAEDQGSPSNVEAGLDEVLIYEPNCPTSCGNTALENRMEIWPNYSMISLVQLICP